MDLDFDLSEAPETNKFVNDLTDILNKINSDNHLCKLRNNDYDKFISEVFNIEEFKPFIDKYNWELVEVVTGMYGDNTKEFCYNGKLIKE